MKQRLGMELYIDYAHTLPGHPQCGIPHGHTARVMIEIEGKVRGGQTYQENMIMDFAEMKKRCKEVLGSLDHHDLNERFPFPSVENVSAWLFQELKKVVPVVGVTFFEGNGKWCTVEEG